MPTHLLKALGTYERQHGHSPLLIHVSTDLVTHPAHRTTRGTLPLTIPTPPSPYIFLKLLLNHDQSASCNPAQSGRQLI